MYLRLFPVRFYYNFRDGGFYVVRFTRHFVKNDAKTPCLLQVKGSRMFEKVLCHLGSYIRLSKAYRSY